MKILLDKLIKVSGWGASIAVLAMMLLLVSDIILRSLGVGSISSCIEFIEFLVVMVTYLGAAPLQKEKGFIRVLILYDRFPKKARIVLDIFSNILFLILFGFIFIKGWESFLKAVEIREVMINITFPAYPFRFIFLIGCLCMCLQLVADLVASFKELLPPRSRSLDTAETV